MVRRRLRFRIVLLVICSLICWLSFREDFDGGEIARNMFNTLKLYKSWRQPVGNFEPLSEKIRHGPGEGGEPHRKVQNQDLISYGVDMDCSDEISLERSILDTRQAECRYRSYPPILPKATIIIVFHNVGWSILMRAVHSVMNRTPQDFLEEILLVDDHSVTINLAGPLKRYIERFHGKVKYIRHTKNEGMINSRNLAAQQAMGDVVVFLDAYCEVNRNWLPPLLFPITKDWRIMTLPIVDIIDKTTFEYRSLHAPNDHHRGIFDWSLQYRESELPSIEKKARHDDIEPYRSPTFGAGFFAIERDFFLTLGGFDPGLLWWGGESLELSFKVWQCGGSIKRVPCSRVGHIYAGPLPYPSAEEVKQYFSRKKKIPSVLYNYRRIAETWMDTKFKEYVYTQLPQARLTYYGNISQQLKLKTKLKCRNFAWFMTKIAYDVLPNYPEPPENLHWGLLRNMETQTCLTVKRLKSVVFTGLLVCSDDNNYQFIRLNARGQLIAEEECIEKGKLDKRNMESIWTLGAVVCVQGRPDGPWVYNSQTYTLYHRDMKKCLESEFGTNRPLLMVCDAGNTYQKWVFQDIKKI